MALLSYDKIEEILDWIESPEGKAAIAASEAKVATAASEDEQEPKTER